MPDLQVDLAGLESFSGSLKHVTQGMNATRRLIDAARPDLGSADVANALDDFESRWDDGREKIDKNGKTLSTMVDESVKAYRKSDDELTKTLHDSMQGGS